MILDAGRTTFRNEIYDKYKANRPEPPEDLIPQFPLIREAAKAFNVSVCELEGYEADDLIATYARLAVEAGGTCTIVSSDKDLMQLIRPGVEMFDPIKQKRLGPDAVMEKFGVTPDKVVDVQALAGNSTDNVPGVPGIGVKTAAQLIGEYGDLETLLARAGEIKQPKRREALQQQRRAGAHLQASWCSCATTCRRRPSRTPSTSASPIPTCCCRGWSSRASRAWSPSTAKELGEATNPVAPALDHGRRSRKPEPAEAKPAPAAHAKPNRAFTAGRLRD